MTRLELIGISKQYPGVRANDGIHLKVAPGQIHAILGENGAGKSTLMKIIYGAVRPDAGQVAWNGREVDVASPAQARALGISMVYQHFSLFDTLTAAENIWLGLDKSRSLAEVAEQTRAVSAAYGLHVDPARPVHTLSVGERQRVEIVRALLTKPQLLILDEPTSVLTPQAVESLFVTLRQLSSEGCSILYISHKLHEIRSLCHHCTVLRGGRVVGEVNPQQETNASLSRLMIGADAPVLAPREGRRGDAVLRVSGLDLAQQDPFGVTLKGVDLTVCAGEIVGVAGVSGNGQQELLAALS
ncbi:ABC transporter, partial [Pelomonas sp. HMWF004]